MPGDISRTTAFVGKEACNGKVMIYARRKTFLMNEEEWLTSIEPQPMLDFLRSRGASDRKLRLFAAACCRRIWGLLTDERSRKAVELAEEFADGSIDRGRLVSARDDAREVRRILKGSSQTPFQRAANAAFDATRDTGRSASNNAPCEAARALNSQDHNQFDVGELRQQAHLLRCLFANPFLPLSLNLTWRTPRVVSLAKAIYDDRSFEHMPSLADALEAAGCDEPDILAHCRSLTEHALGCWVVDAILGKS